MSNPVVFDIDGVLAEFSWDFNNAIDAVHGNVSPHRSTGTRKDWLLIADKDEERKVWDYVEADPQWWFKLYPIVSKPEILEMQHLSTRVDIVYLTGRHALFNQREQTEDWLRVNGLPAGELIMNGGKKAPLLKERGIVPLAMIDDRPDVTQKLHDAGFNVYVRDWAYNRDLSPEIPRVSSVGEFVTNVHEILDVR